MHQYGKEQIVIVENSRALGTGMIVHGTVDYRQGNVDNNTKMRHGCIASCLDVAPSQQDRTLIRKTRILQGHVFGAFRYGMFAH